MLMLLHCWLCNTSNMQLSLLSLYTLINTHILYNKDNIMKQKFFCVLCLSFFPVISCFCRGLFSIQNTDFIKEYDLVFVSGDKQDTGERERGPSQREREREKRGTGNRNKDRKWTEKRASHHISYQIRTHEYGGAEWLQSQSSKCFTNYQAAANTN